MITWNSIVSELEPLVATMNKMADSMFKAVKALEEKLDEIGVGVPAEVGDSELCLCYQRFGAKFRIVVALDDSPPKPWSDLSRDLKYETFFMIPQLLEQILEQTKVRVEHLRGLQ